MPDPINNDTSVSSSGTGVTTISIDIEQPRREGSQWPSYIVTDEQLGNNTAVPIPTHVEYLSDLILGHRPEPSGRKISFSKKHPFEMKLEKSDNEKGREKHREAMEKILFYKSIVKKDPKMSQELRTEIKHEVRRNRAKIRISGKNRGKAVLSYRGIEIEIPVDKSGFISPKDFKKGKEKLVKTLKGIRSRNKKAAKTIKKIEGELYELFGGVHREKGSILNLYHKIAMRRVNSLRRPGANENHVGVEFEFYSSHSRGDVCQRLIDAKLSQYCRIMSDRTIMPPEEKPVGLELCVVAPESELEEILRRACDVLSDIGAESNESCGFHVHIDSRNRNKRLLFHNLVRCQDILFGMTYKNRVNNEYCRPQSTPDWDRANNSHYDAINKSSFDKHRTVEVRLHHGTVDFIESYKWIKLLLKIANHAESIKKITGPGDMGRTLKLDEETKSYIKERIKLFSA